MSSTIDESIKEIAVKHGVSISRDDPILILQTMHQQLLDKQLQTQQEMLDKFKSEIELISSRWQDDAKEKAEKILNASLHTSKASLESILVKAAQEHKDLIKAEVAKSVDEIRHLNREAKAISKFSIIASISILLVACAFVMITFWF